MASQFLDMEIRNGRFTSSVMSKIIYDKAPTEGFETLCYEKAYERLGITEPEEKWVSDAIEWGNKYESMGVFAFEMKAGLTVQNNKVNSRFFPFNENAGCTPDGLIGTNKGLEIKCPYNPAIFLKQAVIKDQIEFKKKFKDYYWQVMSSMYFTGRDSWYFCSFHPVFHEKHDFIGYFEIQKDQAEFDLIQDRLDAAEKFVQEIVNKVKCS